MAHISFNAEDRSYFSILKREIHAMAVGAGFSEKRVAEVDIVVAEISSNLLKHASGGEILVKVQSESDNPSIELISIDNGPGMSDARKMMEDGISTANTLGHGLGAISRLSDKFEVYSLKDWGTIVLARLFKEPLPPFARKPLADVRSVVVAKTGEKLSGDGAYCEIRPDCVRLFLGDGLGHGPEAHGVVEAAIAAVKANPDNSPIEILRSLHLQVKKTRGLVGAIAVYRFADRKWRICGIGNIATRMQSVHTYKNHISYNGIIGLNIPNTLNEQEVDYDHGQVIIMCSDGIKTRWDLQKYTGIFKYDLSILAAAIYKDFARKTDDMSVLVGRINPKI